MVDVLGSLGTVGLGLVVLLVGAFAIGTVRRMARSQTQDTPGDLLDGLATAASGLATLGVVVLAVTLAAGGPLLAGLFGGFTSFASWIAVLGGVFIVARVWDDVSAAFVLTFVAVLAVGTELLPEWLTRPFAFLSQSLFGVQFAQAFDPVAFAVLAVAVVLAYWIVSVRAAGNAKNPSTIANRVLTTKFERLIREYVSLGRVIIVFGFSVGTLLLTEAGGIAAEFASVLADAPLVASNLFTAVVGYFGFGGGVPDFLAWVPGIGAVAEFLANIGPVSFLVVALGVLALAYGIAERLEERAMRLERERERRQAAEEETDSVQESLQGLVRRLRN